MESLGSDVGGLATYLEVLDAQQQLYPAEFDLARTQRDQLLARTRRRPALLRFSGELRFRQCFPSWERVGLARPPGARTELDLAAVEHLDGAAAALLLDLRHELAATGGAVEIVGPTGAVQALLELYGAHRRQPSQKLAPTGIGVLDQIGRETLAMFGESRALDFIADLVGLSMTRELAPLMTAIIVAGRSGAASSAELGTMRVDEEIDALRTLGLDPYHFLVFPSLTIGWTIR